MAGAIKTSRVAGRRQLHFNTLEDILADVDRLAACKEVHNLGNWSPGQVLHHVALVMDKSIDGFAYHLPAVVRFVARLLKRRFLTRPMAAGYRMPSNAAKELGPPATSWEEGLQRIRTAIARLRGQTTRAPHPVFGKFTADEWGQLHCRHAELHLSFLVPAD
jgi:hypothetical protein